MRINDLEEDSSAVPEREGRIVRRKFIRQMAKAALSSGVGLTLLGCPRKNSTIDSIKDFKITKQPPKELTDLSMLCWTDNALDEFVGPFESQYGVRIKRTYFEGNANAFEKMKLGGTQVYDIVQCDALWPQKYAEAGLVDPIDFRDYPDSYPTPWDCFKQPAYQMYKGEWYAFPNCWDAVGVGYNTEKVRPAPTGFDALWDKKYKGQVAFPIVEDNTVQVAALHLGYDDIYCLTQEQLSACYADLVLLRSNARKLYTDLNEIEQLFGRDEAALGLVVISWVILKLKKQGLPFELFTPRVTQGWVDTYMISSGSTHKEMAKFFINWYTSPVSQMNFLKVESKRTCQAGVRRFLTQAEIDFYGMNNPADVLAGLLLYKPTCRAEKYAEILARLKV